MTSKRFKSKIDRWLLYLLVMVMVFEVVVMGIVATRVSSPGEATVLIVAALAIVALIGSMLVGTHYTVAGGTLHVACGPFRWKVPIDEIQLVEATRSPLSSPALSLDRLQIHYGKRRIMVSPSDKAGFMKAIGQDPGNVRR
jgi:membrane protein YdbS with pleckstrin-like domain